MMGRPHSNCRKHHLGYHLCQERTSMEEELIFYISTKLKGSTAIHPKVIRTVQPKTSQTLKIGLTGPVPGIFQLRAMMTGRQTMNPSYSQTMASMIQDAWGSGIWVPHQVFPDWFGQHGGQRTRLKMCWWQWIQRKWGGIRRKRKSRTECVFVLSPASLCCLTENFI